MISFSTEEDVAEEIQDQNEIEQAETSDANVEREISTTEQLTTGAAVDSQLLESAQRSVTPTTSVTITQRLLSARSHLPPFSFPQVRHEIFFPTWKLTLVLIDTAQEATSASLKP